MDATPRTPGQRLVLAGLACLAASLFLSTWSASLQSVDGAVVAAACNLGVAPPPGHPLFTLVGHAFCALPWWSPAARVGLLSVASGVLSVLALAGIVRRLTGQLVAGVLAALTLATGPLFWRHCSLAGTSSLAVALALGTVYFVVRADQAAAVGARRRWAASSALLWALALGHDVSALALLPVVIAMALRGDTMLRQRVTMLLVVVAGALVGLLPILYLLVASPYRLPRWGRTETLGGLWQHLVGASTAEAGGGASLTAMGRLLRALPEQLAWALLPFALWGVVLLLARSRGGEARGTRLTAGTRIGLAASWVLAGPIALGLAGGAGAIERLFLLPTALSAVLLGVGLARLEGLSAIRSRRVGLRLGLALWLTMCALTAFGKADLRQSFAVEDYARNVLRTVEHDALIIGTGALRRDALMYAQRVLGLRPDVQYVALDQLHLGWYVAQQRTLHPRFSYDAPPGKADGRQLVHRALRAGRPVYLANAWVGGVSMAYASYPEGPLRRVVAAGAVPPSTDALIAYNKRLYARYLRRGASPDPRVDPGAALLREVFARSWIELGKTLYTRGLRVPAAALAARGLVWAPWLEQPRWLVWLPGGAAAAKIRTKR